jgi:hypothetical protein
MLSQNEEQPPPRATANIEENWPGLLVGCQTQQTRSFGQQRTIVRRDNYGSNIICRGRLLRRDPMLQHFIVPDSLNFNAPILPHTRRVLKVDMPPSMFAPRSTALSKLANLF